MIIKITHPTSNHAADYLGLSQEVSLAGSIWTRSVTSSLGLQQHFSDFYNIEVESNLGLNAELTTDAPLVLDVLDDLAFIQLITLSGGRIGSAGGGDSSSSFTINYSGDPAPKGLCVYVSGANALLADHTTAPEVAGFLTEVVTDGRVDHHSDRR